MHQLSKQNLTIHIRRQFLQLYNLKLSKLGCDWLQSCRFMLTIDYSNLLLIETYDKSSEVLTVFDQTGKLERQVVACSGNSYRKQGQFRCVSCGFDASYVYSSTLKACSCENGYVRVGESCYKKRISWNVVYTAADAFNFRA